MPADDAPPTRLTRLPSRLITQAAVHANRLVGDSLATADARRYHYSLLAALEEFGPASQAALGRRCGIDRSDVVAMLNELTDRKLVERTTDTADRRRNTVALTPAGTRQLRRLDELLAEVQDQLLAPLTTDERDHLARLLRRILDHHTR